MIDSTTGKEHEHIIGKNITKLGSIRAFKCPLICDLRVESVVGNEREAGCYGLDRNCEYLFPDQLANDGPKMNAHYADDRYLLI